MELVTISKWEIQLIENVFLQSLMRTIPPYKTGLNPSWKLTL